MQRGERFIFDTDLSEVVPPPGTREVPKRTRAVLGRAILALEAIDDVLHLNSPPGEPPAPKPPRSEHEPEDVLIS